VIIRSRRDRNHSLQKNNLIQDSEGNEESRHQVPDLNKTKINYNKETSNTQKTSSRRNLVSNHREFHGEDTRDGLPKCTKYTQEISRQQSKEYEKTQKQINKLRGALNKHHSVAENSINKELNELKMKIENIRRCDL
jgi:hypothetical protein